jgi:hypothetical protein
LRREQLFCPVRLFGIAFPAGGNFFVVVAGLFQIIAARVLKLSRLTAPNLSSPSTLFRLAPIFVFKSETGAGQSFAFSSVVGCRLPVEINSRL